MGLGQGQDTQRAELPVDYREFYAAPSLQNWEGSPTAKVDGENDTEIDVEVMALSSLYNAKEVVVFSLEGGDKAPDRFPTDSYSWVRQSSEDGQEHAFALLPNSEIRLTEAEA